MKFRHIPVPKHLQLNCLFIMVGLVLLKHVQVSHGLFFFANKQRCNCSPDRDCSQSQNGAGTCSPDKCANDFIGVKCQHQPFPQPQEKVLEPVLDNNDSTCFNGSWDGKAIFEFHIPTHFIWTYIFRKRATDTPIKPRLALYNNGHTLNVDFYLLELNKNSFLIKLCEDVIYSKLELSNLPQDTCSVEVSIGRNLAISSDPWIRYDNDSLVSKPADIFRAIDGDEHTSFTLFTKEGGAWWRSRLKNDAKVNLILIKSNLPRYTYCWKCLGQVFASNTSLVFKQENDNFNNELTYLLVAVDASVREVELTFQKKKDKLCRNQEVAIHEVYIFGEYRCPSNMCGVLCEKQCPKGCTREMCDPDWGCSEGCSQTFIHDVCHQRGRGRCGAFEYGPNCEHTCHDNCANEGLCDETNGTCLDGCKPGFKLPDCEAPCENGTYSVNCSKTCKNCAKNYTTGEHVCDHTTGDCKFGCDKGYGGETCEYLIVFPDIYAWLTGRNIACSCVLAVLLVALLRSFIRRRTDAFIMESERMRPNDGTELNDVEESELLTVSNLTSLMASETISSILGNDSSCVEESTTSAATGSTSLYSSTEIGSGSKFTGQSGNSTISTYLSSDAASSFVIVDGQRHTDI